jgi:hypothetical protein
MKVAGCRKEVLRNVPHCLTANCSPRNSLGSLVRSGTSSTARQGWRTQSSGSIWPGYQVGRPFIQNEARMAHTELRINKARLSGGKATHQKETRMAHTELRINIARIPGRKATHVNSGGQDGPQRAQDQHGQDIR